eukprot:gnl/TRDRNA2_/TRDRNA2_162758_c0_seq3.p1 gnl/TRDRNA2_/TRDRNA2_162758_c0~~gnl/TRDRNA2_/TRDRNA2_162758_c0_seq3.p1  ORF type:complete len:115 (-),score=18.43 gnl/TRDRNA2_/TRDRNA2_162758_c0_seq3:99-443(-)
MTTWYFVLLIAFGVMSVQQVFCQSNLSSTSSDVDDEPAISDDDESAAPAISCRDFSCPVKYELKYKAANIAANTQSLCCNLVSTVVNNAAHNMRPLFLYFLILAAGLAGVRLVV